METPQVTVVCAAFHRAEALAETIRRLRVGMGVPFELFICDNSDEPLDLPIELQAHEHYSFMNGNRGTAARVHGIRTAKAPYLLMLDDDSHPLPGAVPAAVAKLDALPQKVAGLIAHVTHPAGAAEASLLPTVSLGCGVLFRTEALKAIDGGYPENFLFYGEEYWQTLILYQRGWQLSFCPELKILHRCDKTPGNKARVFYHLARNNSVIWEAFAPADYLNCVLRDTYRRYELLSKKEGVHQAFLDGRAAALTLADEPHEEPLTLEQFGRFSLLDDFAQMALSPKLALCGTGKFPTLWTRELQCRGVEDLALLDFNPGLIGHAYGEHTVRPPDDVAELAQAGYRFVIGHSSPVDNARWQSLLVDRGLPAIGIHDWR